MIASRSELRPGRAKTSTNVALLSQSGRRRDHGGYHHGPQVAAYLQVIRHKNATKFMAVEEISQMDGRTLGFSMDESLLCEHSRSWMSLRAVEAAEL